MKLCSLNNLTCQDMKFKKLTLPKFDLDAVLKLIFYVLVLLTFIAYFVYQDRYPSLFLYFGFSALALRLIHYLIVFYQKK